MCVHLCVWWWCVLYTITYAHTHTQTHILSQQNTRIHINEQWLIFHSSSLQRQWTLARTGVKKWCVHAHTLPHIATRTLEKNSHPHTHAHYSTYPFPLSRTADALWLLFACGFVCVRPSLRCLWPRAGAFGYVKSLVDASMCVCMVCVWTHKTHTHKHTYTSIHVYAWIYR